MSAISRTIRAAFYHAAFITVRFIAIELPTIARRRGQHRATSKMHRHHRWGDPLQSLGGPRDGPAPLRQSRRDDEPPGSTTGEPER